MSETQSTLEVSAVSGAVAPELSLGPLSVEVLPERGESQRFVLTSARPMHRLSLPFGRYVIVARRPNGERLRRAVTVAEGETVHVALGDSIAFPKEDFLRADVLSGRIASRATLAREATESVVGFDGHTLRLLSGHRSDVRSVTCRLRLWAAGTTARETLRCDVSPSFLKVSSLRHALAVGLVDGEGFGPIVMLPPWASNMSVTFIADGIATWAVQRAQNPASVRAPVALAAIEQPELNDLLITLASPIVEDATAFWTENFGAADRVEQALEQVGRKFECPAEALLAAHYLLRFMPDRLPLSWADRLVDVLPDSADGPVIAAWLRLSGEGAAVNALSSETIDEDVNRLLRQACERPLAFFARTRLLLTRGLALLDNTLAPGSVNARSSARERHTKCFSHGAQAGGLEAFWGTGPLNPGADRHGVSSGYEDLAEYSLAGSTFKA